MLRSRLLTSCSILFAASLLAGCGGFDDGIVEDPPDNQGPPTGPADPPPTGSKWFGVEVEGSCGRVKLAYVLIDEVCGGTEDPQYMDYFHAPIMRDGIVIADHLYTVDATNLWVLDVTDADELERRALLTGFGDPMAVAEHAGQLLIAAGSEGLILVDVTDPAAPVRLADLPLAGPALDVYVEGDTALVATGFGGVEVVDLTTPGELASVSTLSVPGFAAAVASKEGVAYVAACDTFATIDISTGALLGQNWLSDAYKDDILVAPAKDVSVVGNVAFVAAGRYGAVAVDVSDPHSPLPFGNCTLQSDESFYASGVRERNGKMYIAGGEYGILPVDVTDPQVACTSLVSPVLPPPPDDESVCTLEPPWEIVPWTESWAPPSTPPEGRDPLQTLPLDGRIYAFGDATRIGLRAIDIRNPLDLDEKLGRYSEPRLTEGIASQGDLVLLAGKKGGLFSLDADGAIARVADLPEAKLARAAAFLGDGSWVLGGLSPNTGGGIVYVEDRAPIEFDTPIWAGSIAAKAATVYVPTAMGVVAYDMDDTSTTFATAREAHLPQSIAVAEDHLVVAAPEWTSGLRIDGAGTTPLDVIGTFDEIAISDVSAWRKALPRRVVMTNDLGIMEVASLGGQAGLTVHTTSSTSSVALPAGDYIAATYASNRVYALAVDRGRYRSQLVTVDLTDGEPIVSGVIAFAGSATSVTASGSHLLVADSDRGIRNFDITTSSPTLVQILELSQEGP